MTAAPFPNPAAPELPDHLPARMVNEFVYCPRLFYYEWVEGVFTESADTLEGSAQHKRVDKEGQALPPADEADDIRTRSVTLSSEQHRVIAKLDLLEIENGVATPVDYKHGKPRETPSGLELWPADRMQLAVQGLILREHGYRCEEGIVYYSATRQRVRVAFEEEVMKEAAAAISAAWRLARERVIPPPLEDSPKCPGCSLVNICLPDEVNGLSGACEDGEDQLALFAVGSVRKPPHRETRRLIAPRADLRPVYLNTQGLRIGKSGAVLQVKDKDSVVQEIRVGEISQLNLMGNVQISTQAVQTLCEAEAPVCYFSMSGWFYGITTGLCTKNVFLRKSQFELAEKEWFCRKLAMALVAGKIRNHRTMLLRNHVEPDPVVLQQLKEMAERAEASEGIGELLGIEGNAARLYFGSFNGMIKADDANGQVPAAFRLDFATRNRRPPRDAVNALLSLAYSLLAKDLTIACYAVGFDPMIGFYHQPRFGRPALALDLMEPFRPLIADSAVLTAINTGMVGPGNFIQVGDAVALKAEGRKAFYRAYELRMDTLVTHPLFEYRVSYRRMLEIQARLLGKMLQGEIGNYPVFITR